MSVNIKTQSGLKRFAGNTISTTATHFASGLMSQEDKLKLDSFQSAGIQIDAFGYSGSSSDDVVISRARLSEYDFFMLIHGTDTTGCTYQGYNTISWLDYSPMIIPTFNMLNNGTFPFLTMSWGIIEENRNHDFVVKNEADEYLACYGIKLKGQTASGGGKVLAFETDLDASTYRIKGSADATPLTIEIVVDRMYNGKITSFNMYSYVASVRQGMIATLSANTSIMSSTCGSIKAEKTGADTIVLNNTQDYKFQVWITGSGWTVEKV